VSAPKILVADDSPLVLRMLEKLLGDAGLSVITARDGIEAVEKTFTECPDFVILDVMMPRMNGYQACRLLKSEPATRGLPIVILTSKDQPGDRFWGLQTGADRYITKDEDPQRILKAIQELLGETRKRRPKRAKKNLSRVNELLDRKLFEATIVSEIAGASQGPDGLDVTFVSVMEVVTRVVDFTVGAIAFLDGEELDVLILPKRNVASAVVEELKTRVFDALAEHRSGDAAPRLQSRIVSPSTAPPEAAAEQTLGGFVAFPVLAGEQAVGLLALGGRAAGRVGRDDAEFLGQVATQSYIVAVNSRLVDRLRNLSMRDSLTDLYNHRHSIDLITNEFQRAGRYEGGLSLVMIDVDHFKRINDEYGHQAGDIVLRETARLMKDVLRTVDSLGRYGGEEFVAILPHTTHEDACQTAERLRQAVADNVFRSGSKELRVTISLGVASYPSEKVDSAGSLIREADHALYRAKQAGRNRVA